VHQSADKLFDKGSPAPDLLLEIGDATDLRLTGWRENVGAQVSRKFAPAGSSTNANFPVLTLLSWNVWIGRGRLRQLVSRIRSGDYADLGIAPGPLVVLVQEAFREDATVPPASNGWGPRERPLEPLGREDIVELAAELALNVVYVPSMRNASHPSDRGNAILSDLDLTEASAFELPFVAQRRVSVAATVHVAAPGGATLPLRVCSAHLDPWGTLKKDWLGAAGRAVQARSLLEAIQQGATALPLALGADLNISRGRREAAYRMIAEAGFTAGVPHQEPTWRHTYHVMPRLAIDYLLFRDAVGSEAVLGNGRRRIGRAVVWRLNEDPRDRGPYVFGSDHHPLIAAVQLEPPAERSR
jgi:endonuclease/exonuclease/phosphatase family metal-dependent hydrolase